MSSKNSISRIIVTVSCALVAVLAALSLIRVFDNIKAYPFLDLMIALITPITLIAFCGLAILKNDNKDKLVSLALAAYAGINAAWTFIKACEAIAHGYFNVDYLVNIAFFAILLLFAAKNVLPIPGKENLETPIMQIIAIACIWAIPLIQMFILPLIMGPSHSPQQVGGGMMTALLSFILQSIVFTWFIKK